MRLLVCLLIMMVSCKEMKGQIDSTVWAIPVNNTIKKGFALSDATVKFLPSFAADTTNELNIDGEMWFWLYAIDVTPEVHFISQTGMKELTIYGPFSKEYLNATDSIENELTIPMFSIVANDSIQEFDISMPSLAAEGLYIIKTMTLMQNSELKIEPESMVSERTDNKRVVGRPNPCLACLDDELPAAGKYVINAWVHVPNLPASTNYSTPYVQVSLDHAGVITTYNFTTTGYVIDGWQLIEGTFEILADFDQYQINLQTTAGVAYFDDVRFFPFDGSMKTYVYDPFTLRLAAELDERHYATFYEYDEEGKLKRIKKETERGIMTIQETTNSQVK